MAIPPVLPAGRPRDSSAAEVQSGYGYPLRHLIEDRPFGTVTLKSP
jgi:hypothetical protein